MSASISQSVFFSIPFLQPPRLEKIDVLYMPGYGSAIDISAHYICLQKPEREARSGVCSPLGEIGRRNRSYRPRRPRRNIWSRTANSRIGGETAAEGCFGRSLCTAVARFVSVISRRGELSQLLSGIRTTTHSHDEARSEAGLTSARGCWALKYAQYKCYSSGGGRKNRVRRRRVYGSPNLCERRSNNLKEKKGR